MNRSLIRARYSSKAFLPFSPILRNVLGFLPTNSLSITRYSADSMKYILAGEIVRWVLAYRFKNSVSVGLDDFHQFVDMTCTGTSGFGHFSLDFSPSIISYSRLNGKDLWELALIVLGLLDIGKYNCPYGLTVPNCRKSDWG